MKFMTKHPFFCLLAVLIVVYHAGAAYLKVSEIPPSEYARYAMDLRITEKHRYGYVVPHHGAILVRTANTPEAGYPKYEDPDPEVTAIMLRELRWYPAKAIIEAVFYALIIGYIFFWARWLQRQIVPPDSNLAWLMAFGALFWIGGWTLATCPLQAFSYGESIFTTWAGPGALSWSGPYFGAPTGLAGETISYRPMLELGCLFPAFFMGATGLARLLPDLPMATAIWVYGTVFFGLVGALTAYVKERIFP